MFEIDNILFLAFIGLGALIQTITGFAMGLVIIGGVTLFGVADISFAAAVISLISSFNIMLALRTSYKHVNWGYVKKVAISMVPALLAGVWLLNYLSYESYTLLKKLLGGVIVGAGILMMLKPTPFRQVPADFWLWSVGGLGGLIGGMFSAGGAPLAYYMYRQPLEVNIIRATLLAFFAVTTLARSIVVGIDGQLTADVWTIVMLAVPLVLLVTVGTTRMLHLIPDVLVRKIVFVLLIFMGLFLIVR